MRRVLLILPLFAARAIAAQTSTADLVAVARTHITAHELDTAEITLQVALANARYMMDSVSVYIWYGVLEYLRGEDSVARLSFRQALTMHADVGDLGLEQISPELARVFDAEARAIRVYYGRDVDQPARWRSVPVFVYPPELRHSRIAGHALVRAVVDTLGQVIDKTIEVLHTPDSAFSAPLTHMMSGAQFYPARVKRRPVRSWVSYELNITPPGAQNPLRLIEEARDQLRVHKPDSALALIDMALDSVNAASAAIQMYGQIVQGIAWHTKGRDSLAARSFETARKAYRELKVRRVDLAPFLIRLADSVQITHSAP